MLWVLKVAAQSKCDIQTYFIQIKGCDSGVIWALLNYNRYSPSFLLGSTWHENLVCCILSLPDRWRGHSQSQSVKLLFKDTWLPITGSHKYKDICVQKETFSLLCCITVSVFFFLVPAMSHCYCSTNLIDGFSIVSLVWNTCNEFMSIFLSVLGSNLYALTQVYKKVILIYVVDWLCNLPFSLTL